MLQLNGVVSGYGEKLVINGIDLVLKTHEIVAVLGRNGVGKTTLLRTIMGLNQCRKGSIRFESQDITLQPTYMRSRSGIAYVPQGRMIFPRLSVLDNLKSGAVAGNVNVRSKLDRIVEEFPILKSKLKARGGSLSGGQQQILAIARALMSSPKLLLLDEPSEGVQPSIVEEIFSKISEVCRVEGIAVILIEQNLEYVSELCSRAYLMDKGNFIREVEPKVIVADKTLQHEYLGI